MNKFDDDVEPFVHDDMTREDYKVLGQYLVKRWFRKRFGWLRRKKK